LDLIASFLLTLFGIPIAALLVAVYQTKDWTPPSEAKLDYPNDDIYTRHEAFNRYEDLEYKEM
jgi:hypothetical protein